MTEPLVIVESTTIALTPRPLDSYRPALLTRITELMVNERLSEEYGVLHDTAAMDALGLLRAGGYQVAVYRPTGEQKTGMLFWGHGFALTDVRWGELLVTREQGAVFITTPQKKHTAPTHMRHRFVTAGLLRLNARTVAAAAIHGRVT